MKTAVVVIAILTALSGMSAGQAGPDWRVFLRRTGPIRIGMFIAEVRQALGDPQAFLAWIDKEPDTSQCAYLQSPVIPKSVGFMFQNGRVVRVDVRAPGIRTASGAGVRDPAEKIQLLYPDRITVEPHKYLPETGHYLNYISVDRADLNYGMIFETEHERVTSFRAGTRAAIALVEGCG